MMLGLDTETTGLDLRHGAKPYFISTAHEDGTNEWWEWDVDPLTREPKVSKRDIREIHKAIDGADSLVLQNPKFDVAALNAIDPAFGENWPWEKTYDTLLAGHLLASNEPHDLTSMVLIYLGVNMQPYEDDIMEATKACRRICQNKNTPYPDWRIAKVGDPLMPSAKGKVWKYDMWLPRAMAKAKQCTVVNKRTEAFDVYIGRGSPWGNPFRIGKDGNRNQVIAKYRSWIETKPDLLERLPELFGKRLGCHCSPKPCHGDVLASLVAEKTKGGKELEEYGNSDPTITLALFERQKELLKERGLWEIYLERLKLLPVVYGMESRGITLNRGRMQKLQKEYTKETKRLGNRCLNIAKGFDYDLVLPKGAANNSLRSFLFGKSGLNLKPVKTSKKTGAPSFDKEAVVIYRATLPPKSMALKFIESLSAKRSRDTALSYMESYEHFWLPTDKYNAKGEQLWYRLFPSLNPTGTATLRWSSSNPNEQNVSKKPGFNLRYCFGPLPGREWWALDYNNLELRIPAYEAGEKEMIALFEKPNEPPYFGSNHLLVFSILHPEKWNHKDPEGLLKAKKIHEPWYGRTKNGNFAVQYGAMEQSGTADRAYGVSGAQRKIQKRFPAIKRFSEYQIAYANKHGYVETMPDKTLGCERGYPLYCSRSRWNKISPTIPLSYHVQGTACWCIGKAMVRCQTFLSTLPNYHMIMQVHDEIVFDFPKGKHPKSNLAKVKSLAGLMEKSGDDIGVPLTVSIEYHPNNWSETVEL